RLLEAADGDQVRAEAAVLYPCVADTTAGRIAGGVTGKIVLDAIAPVFCKRTTCIQEKTAHFGAVAEVVVICVIGSSIQLQPATKLEAEAAIGGTRCDTAAIIGNLCRVSRWCCGTGRRRSRSSTKRLQPGLECLQLSL